MPNYVYGGDVVAQQIFDVEDSDSQNLLKSSVLDSILKNTRPNISPRYAPTNVSKDLVIAFTHNYAKKVEKYYKYGRDRHPDWIPSNTITNYTNPDDPEIDYNLPHEDMQGLIEAQAGEPVQVQWYYFGSPNITLLANYAMSQDAAYEMHDRVSLTYSRVRFTVVSTGKVYQPKRYTFVGSTLTVYAQIAVWFVSPIDGNQTGSWVVRDGPEVPFVFDMSLINGVESTDTHLHQVFYFTLGTREPGTWYYNEADGTYPNIDGSVPLPEDSNGSFPFAMVIEDGKVISEDGLGPEYKDATNGLLGTIDLDLSKIMEALDDPEDPTAIEDVKDAFVLFSINVDNDTEGTLQYLYEHFRDYYMKSFPGLDASHQNWINNHVADPDTGSAHSMNFRNNRVQFAIRNRWVRVTVKTGNVTDTFAPLTDLSTPYPYSGIIDGDNGGNVYEVNGVKVGLVTKQIVLGTEYGMSETQVNSINSHQLILRKQLTETTFVEIVVMGLAHQSYITNYNIDGSNAGREAIYVINTVADLSNGKFFIPLSYNVVHHFNAILRSRIFYESLTVGIHLFTATKLPWYADAKLMSFIRIFLFIITWGNSELWLQGLWEILKQIVTQIVIQLLVTEAITLLVDLVGGEVALVLAAIAVAFGVAKGISGNNFDQLFGLLNADQLLQGATLLVEATNQSVKDDFLELQARADAHADYVEAEEARLEEIEAQIDEGVTIDLTSQLRRLPILDTHETPTDFFNRNVHITNPGVLSLDTIDAYTNNLLELPKYKPKLIRDK